MIVSTGPIADPPPAISAANPPSPVLYSVTSVGNGTYGIEVKASTHSTYYMRAFYSTLNSDEKTFSTTSKTRSGITVSAGAKAVNQDFAWP